MSHYLQFFVLGLGLGVLCMYLAWYVQWLGYSRHRNIPVDDIWDWEREPKNDRTFCDEMINMIGSNDPIMVTVLKSRWCKGKLVSTETITRVQDSESST